MDIGNQVNAPRLRRGVTQEAMAKHFGHYLTSRQQMGMRFIRP